MAAPQIFVTGAIVRHALHQRLMSTLHDAGADTQLYEWSKVEESPGAEALQALYQRPMTLISVSGTDITPDALPTLIRRAKTIAIYNPARLVLPLPVEPLDGDRLKKVFPFASPLLAQPPRSETAIIHRALVFTALGPLSPGEDASPEARLFIGQALICQHRFEEAVGWLLPLTSTPVPPYGAQSALAYCYARLEQWEACVEASKVAFEQAHERTTSSYCLGLGLNGLGQYEAAVNAFRRALATNKQLSGAWVGLGIALTHLGRYAEALQAFEQGLKVSPTNEWAYEDPASFTEAQRYITQVHRVIERQ